MTSRQGSYWIGQACPSMAHVFTSAEESPACSRGTAYSANFIKPFLKFFSLSTLLLRAENVSLQARLLAERRPVPRALSRACGFRLPLAIPGPRQKGAREARGPARGFLPLRQSHPPRRRRGPPPLRCRAPRSWPQPYYVSLPGQGLRGGGSSAWLLARASRKETDISVTVIGSPQPKK